MLDGYVSPWWQAVLLPSRWDLCGIEIGVMSVWHLFALEQLDNAYVCGGLGDRDAAASLILICQRDFEDGRALYLRPRVRARALASIHRDIKPLKIEDLRAACSDYVTACLRVPEHLRPTDGSGKSLKAPYQWHLILCLCERYGMTKYQAWNHPYAEARCLYDAWQESKGDESLAGASVQRHTDEALERQLGKVNP